MTLAPEAHAETRSRAARPASPFVGLVPFGEDDARFFFGRTQEVAIVSANLRSSRLTLVYGASGVGKSSLLQAGVVHRLRRESLRAHDERPFAVCVLRSWLDDPLPALEEVAHAALQELAGDEPLAPPAATLAGSLRAWTGQAGTLLVVLDQFEDYFLYHPDEGGDELSGFAAELAEIVNDPAVEVHVLLSVREDAWALLDRFEGHIPSLFVNYLRVDHLDVEAAREAIEGPIGAWNRTLPPGEPPYYVRPELVDAVLAAATGNALAYAAGAETATADTGGDRVEAPFLQLVLERLWRETVAEGSRVLTLDTLERLGGARRIVERHLQDALGRLTPREQDVASDCFRFLVTRAKTKIAHPAADLAEWTGRPEREVTRVLGMLCTAESGRILRAVAPATDEGQGPSYELFHDVLADPVLAWRRRHEAERARRAFRRRLVRVGTAALALVAIFAALAGWALVERQHTKRLLTAKEQSNTLLQRRIVSLSARSVAARKAAIREAGVVSGLRVRNGRLTTQTVVLVKGRNGLDRQIRGIRVENVALARQIRRLNGQNTALAKTVNRLDAAFAQLGTQLETLRAQHGELAGYAAIIRRENAALAAEQKALEQANAVLQRKAAALGWHPVAASASQAASQSTAAAAPPERASLFVVPGDTAGSDALRRRAAALARQLVLLQSRRARSVDEAAWLTRENRILVRERDVLRLETARLERTLANVRSRHATLAQNDAAAAAEHKRLAGLKAARVARNARMTKTVGAQQKKDSLLQERTNTQIGDVGGARDEISRLEDDNKALVAFIDPRVGRLIGAARSPAQAPKLAGLLAVEAAHLSAYEPDDQEHPEAYNALWLALNRLDPTAAHDLIAPTKNPHGKVGTTAGTTLENAVCKRAAGTLTRAEWSRFFPAEAPYSHAAATPCG